MTWNYRLLKMGDCYEVCEVVYTRRGKIHGWSTGHTVLGETKAAIKWQLTAMRQALSRPALEVKIVRGKLTLVEVKS